MRGRKPKPSVIKLLEGNPGKRAIHNQEPVAPSDLPECPDWLADEAKAEWQRIVPELSAMGVLSSVDRPALAAYCQLWARWVDAEAQIRQFGSVVQNAAKGLPKKSPYLLIAEQSLEALRKFLVEFGLTPSSRGRIHVPNPAAKVDEFDQFLQVDPSTFENHL